MSVLYSILLWLQAACRQQFIYIYLCSPSAVTTKYRTIHPWQVPPPSQVRSSSTFLPTSSTAPRSCTAFSTPVGFVLRTARLAAPLRFASALGTLRLLPSSVRVTMFRLSRTPSSIQTPFIMLCTLTTRQVRSDASEFWMWMPQGSIPWASRTTTNPDGGENLIILSPSAAAVTTRSRTIQSYLPRPKHRPLPLRRVEWHWARRGGVGLLVYYQHSPRGLCW